MLNLFNNPIAFLFGSGFDILRIRGTFLGRLGYPSPTAKWVVRRLGTKPWPAAW